jgi:parvulin-like peptidyl-prolyl isomerase
MALMLAAVALAGCQAQGPAAGDEPSIGPVELDGSPGGSASGAGTAARPASGADGEGTSADDSAAAGRAFDEAAGLEVMAYVNGQPIYMTELHDLLVRSHGLPLAQQLIALELVRQEAGRRGVTVSEADLAREHRRSLEQMFPQVDSDRQRERLLEQLQAKGKVSPTQWKLTMQRNALLSAMAARQVQVTEQDLREAFAEEFGRRVVIRHIQVPSLPAAQQVLKRLESGADFETVARETSVNPSRARGGLLPAFGKDTEGVPYALRQAALSMEREGQISDPVQVMTAFHILKLEEIIEPKDVAFDDVRGRLIDEVRREKIQQRKNRILVELFRDAKNEDGIEYVDPTLQALEAERKKQAQP